jgi:septum formation protein
MRQIILASTSPRRKELLEEMGLDFTVVPSDFEEYLDDSRPVEDIAMELGAGKARAVAEKYPEAIVIGSDTIVTIGEVQLGKAADPQRRAPHVAAHHHRAK